MINCAVTVSLVEQTRGAGPFVFQGDLADACRDARRLGFDAIELFPPAAEFADRENLPRLLKDSALHMATVGTGAGWLLHGLTLSSSEPAIRARAIDFVRSIIDLAGSLNAPAIIGSMQGRAPTAKDCESALGYLAESLSTLAAHAGQFAVPLLIEPLNRYETNLLNSLESGVALISRAGSPNLKLLADLFHMNIEEVSIDQSLRAAGKHVGHVHLADSNRRAAGMGHTDFAPIAAALNSIEFVGYVSAEVFPLPDAGQAAAQTMETYKKIFAV